MSDPIQGYTKNELITAAIFPLGYNSTDIAGDFQTYLNLTFDQVLMEFCDKNDWRFLRDEATMTIGNGVRTYNFQTNLIYVKDIEALFITTTGKGRRVFSDTYQRLKQADPELLNVAQPQYYAWWGESTIYFDATTDQSYTAKVLYKKIVPQVSQTTDYTIVPRRLQKNIINGLRAVVASDKGDKRAGEFFTIYANGIQQSMAEENMMMDSGNLRSDENYPTTGQRETYNDYLARIY